MNLHHEFTVPVPAADAWRILTDLQRLAPCLPGAQLTEVVGDVYHGQVKVKVGPIVAQFKGQASFVSRDDAGYTASLKAEGRDTAGKGNASATITAVLRPTGESSATCTVDTDLNITGKVAQFGRGALADVSDKLLLQFVDNLNALIAAGSGAGGAAGTSGDARGDAGTTPASSNGSRHVESDDVAPLDLLEVAGGTIFKRLVPVVVVIAAVIGVILVFR